MRKTPQGTNLRWADAILRDAQLSSKAKLAGVTIALRFCDWQTLGSIRPGAPLLASVTGLGERTVKRAMAELVDAGYLVLDAKGSFGRASHYHGTFPQAPTHARVSESAPLDFGPYSGKSIAEVYETDPGYVEAMLTWADIAPALRDAVRRFLRGAA